MESEPGGVMSFSRRGFFFLMMSARPPSVVLGSALLCALAMAVPARRAMEVKAERRPKDPSESPLEGETFWSVNFSAPNLHSSRQSPHTTQRE